MVTQIRTETAPLTLEITKHYSRMKALAGDRDVDTTRGRARVNKLRALNCAGQFHSPVWSTVQVSSEHGAKFRVDGAHSSRMLVEAGADFPEGLDVTIRHFRADTLAEAACLWEQFNPKLSTRTTLDLVKNRAAYVSEFENLNLAPSTILSAARGIAGHLNYCEATTNANPLECLGVYPRFIIFAANYVGCHRFKKVGVIAAMFSTWGRSESHAETFWSEVRVGAGVEKADPTRRLSKYLDDMVTAAKCRGIIDLPFVQYVKCHHAWNAWRRGKTTALNYVNGCPVPTAL